MILAADAAKAIGHATGAFSHSINHIGRFFLL